MSKVFREWFDTVDKNSQEWLDFVKQQEQDDEMSAQILEDMDGSQITPRKFPIKAGSAPEVVSRLDSIARSELYFTQVVKVGEESAVKSKVTLVLLNEGKSCDIPQDIRSKLES